MIDNDEIIDAKFLLDWNEDSSRFKFYIDKFVPCKSLNSLLSLLYLITVFLVSELIVLFILKDMSPISKGSYDVFKNFFVLGILGILSFMSVIVFIWFLIEVVFIKPRFRISKSNKFYITDGVGIYIVEYSINSKSLSSTCKFPSIVDKIISEYPRKKLDKRFFTSIHYLDSYNVVSCSSEYVVLDVPSESSIYDDMYDFEITSDVVGFSELRDYIDETEGGYYFD